MKTIVDVAKAANVSVASVSKVFNGYSDISDTTRDRILQIAKELDYFPSHLASHLVKGKVDSLCVVLSMFGHNTSKDEYLVGILSGIHSEAEKHGLRVVISTENAVIGKDNRNYVQFCHSNKFMGFIIHGLGLGDSEIPHLVESEVPCVFIDILLKGAKKVAVTTDNVRACVEAVDFLVSFGHQEIAFVEGSEDSWVTLERVKGYREGMVKHGLEPHIIKTDFTYASSYSNTRNYLTKRAVTTAIFCASDVVAASAMAACLDLGFKVPEDISIIGYDDLSLASYIRPNISTVAQDFFGMGAAAVASLIDIYKGKETPEVRYIPHELKIRQSVARNTRRAI
ncbi:MAG: LacI family transcriptional regulator [Treponema sp.]|nr:LacI family transcriptional regulator [Treponema sp.]